MEGIDYLPRRYLNAVASHYYSRGKTHTGQQYNELPSSEAAEVKSNADFDVDQRAVHE